MKNRTHTRRLDGVRRFSVMARFGLAAAVTVPNYSSGSTPSSASTTSSVSESEVPTDNFNWTKEREFWSFRPPTNQPVPRVRNQRWPRQPLDYFILSRLEAMQLAPSSEAGKRTLIRRVTFDLSGLPPTPQEVDRFLADKRGDAFERLVDRLLASARFGER